MYDAANKITERITMFDLFDLYGFTPDKKGFIKCPFHNEKTASLRVYKNGTRFKCFGCNEGGSVIDFVRKLFNLDFKSAIIKLDYDFNLNVLNTRPLTIEEKRKIKAEQEKRNKARKYKENLKMQEKAFYHVLCELEALKRTFKIKTPDDITDVYAYLLNKIDYYAYICECLGKELKNIYS